ncbi:hypothetical protein CAAN3_21S01596 [[Candida] anglica]
MKRLFRRHRNSDSGPSRPRQQESSQQSPQQSTTPRSLDHLDLSSMVARRDEFEQTIQDDSESVESAPLSDTNTLYYSNQERLQLQETYNQNFTMYLPYLIRQLRLNSSDNNANYSMYHHAELTSSQETVASTANKYSIMGKLAINYNHKRRMILVHELFKNSTLLFLNEESFSLFKDLRAQHKDKLTIVPEKYRSKGLGMPFLRMDSHSYLKVGEDNADITFQRFYENVKKPKIETSSPPPISYRYCNVQIKSFTSIKRLTFIFYPEGKPSFKVILFQHNFKPIADFCYKDTRFRIFGNSLISFGVVPNFKLLIIDKDKPSLCDNVYDRPFFKISSIVKKRRSSSVSLDGNSGNMPEVDITKMANPYPNADNPLLKFDQSQYISRNKSYVSNDLPPFGNVQDAHSYLKETSVIPKRYREQARLETYSDLSSMSPGIDTKSTNSLDIDTLVLACINMTIREIVSKRNSKVTSNLELVNRYNYMGGSIYANSGGGGILGSM